MTVYIIRLDRKTIKQAGALLEAAEFNIIEYDEDLDYVKVIGVKDPYLCFSDISATLEPNYYVW